MSHAGPFTRFRNLDGERRALLARAAITVALSSAAVALLPFRRAIRFGSVETAGPAGQGIEDWLWAVEAAARRVPWRAVCIEKGLALQRLLRRDGIDARLHYGARHDPNDGKLQAHVWVTVGERTVIGGEEAPGFTEIASYP
jgi:hypothetical protein